ncbi:MAG: hypothetical protein HUJ55_02120 [Ileibacterium sp.]|nr:hypothetical protein [Ileibacterium sp.]
MAKDYFKDCKEITNTILEYLENNEDFDDNLSYTIDILNIDGTDAKVMVCDQRLNLIKTDGIWNMAANTEA